MQNLALAALTHMVALIHSSWIHRVFLYNFIWTNFTRWEKKNIRNQDGETEKEKTNKQGKLISSKDISKSKSTRISTQNSKGN